MIKINPLGNFCYTWCIKTSRRKTDEKPEKRRRNTVETLFLYRTIRNQAKEGENFSWGGREGSNHPRATCHESKLRLKTASLFTKVGAGNSREPDNACVTLMDEKRFSGFFSVLFVPVCPLLGKSHTRQCTKSEHDPVQGKYKQIKSFQIERDKRERITV